MARMIGTYVNVAGILLGGMIGLAWRGSLTPASEAYFKIALAVAAVWFGLRLTWISVSGSFLQVVAQLLVVVLSMMIGKILGKLLGMQKLSNALGQNARERIQVARPGRSNNLNEGFQVCAALFCAAPLGFLGAITDGLTGYAAPLVIKGAMECLATIGFVRLFGWGCLVSALPVLALQGTISLCCHHGLEPWLRAHYLVNAVNATAGLMVFSVALVILELKKIELTDYLPSLVVAPVLALLFK